jgi:Tfp pilus assembly protein PilF
MLAAPQRQEGRQKMKNKALALALAAALSGCSASPLDELQNNLKALARAIFASKGQAALRDALELYDGGDYAAAEETFKKALDYGLERQERVIAYKHLAFIECAGGRLQECRNQFRLALRADPRTDLEPAEAGHPAWGPVFNSLVR